MGEEAKRGASALFNSCRFGVDENVLKRDEVERREGGINYEAEREVVEKIVGRGLNIGTLLLPASARRRRWEMDLHALIALEEDASRMTERAEHLLEKEEHAL